GFTISPSRAISGDSLSNNGLLDSASALHIIRNNSGWNCNSKENLFSMLAATGAMLTNLVGNYLLVPEYGALGAAASTAVAFIVFYVLRTEFSCFVWRRMPRFKSYLVVLGLAFLSFFTGFASYSHVYFIALWCFAFVIGLFVFQATVKLAIKGLRKYAFNV